MPREYHPDEAVKLQFQDREVVTVEPSLFEKARDRFLDIFRVSCIGELCKDGFRATVTIPVGPLGYQMLLGFGTDCRCLGPESFQKGFTEYVQELAAFHQIGK